MFLYGTSGILRYFACLIATHPLTPTCPILPNRTFAIQNPYSVCPFLVNRTHSSINLCSMCSFLPNRTCEVWQKDI